MIDDKEEEVIKLAKEMEICKNLFCTTSKF